MCLCAGIFAHALRSPKLAHLKHNEREPHNQEMCTVPNTVDVTRWGRPYIRSTEAVYMVAGSRRRFWASESENPRSHFFFYKITSDFVGTRIVRIWGLHPAPETMVISVLLLNQLSYAAASPIVETSLGSIKGVRVSADVEAFKGIRFAKPPLGKASTSEVSHRNLFFRLAHIHTTYFHRRAPIRRG